MRAPRKSLLRRLSKGDFEILAVPSTATIAGIGKSKQRPPLTIANLPGKMRVPGRWARNRALARISQCGGPMDGIDAALKGAVCRAGVPGHVIAGEKQLRMGLVLRGFELRSKAS